MDEQEKLEISLPEVTIRDRKRKKSSSKKYEYILLCLDEKKYPKMLYYCNSENNEFEVVLLNKKNADWSPENIRLFRDLDRISSKKYNEDLQNYAEKTRGRFKSIMGKLEGKYVERIETRKRKSLTVLKYKILKRNSGDMESINSVVSRKVVNIHGNKNKKKMGGTPNGPSPNKMMRTSSLKRIDGTPDGPSRNKMMKKTPPLVLPAYDINSIQDIGANYSSGLNHINFNVGNLQNAISDVSTYGSNEENNNSFEEIQIGKIREELKKCENFEEIQIGKIKEELKKCENFKEREVSWKLVEELNKCKLTDSIYDESSFYGEENKVMVADPLLSSAAELEENLEYQYIYGFGDSYSNLDDLNSNCYQEQ